MAKLKKPVKKLDLSGPIEIASSNFDVTSYDYDALQGPDPQLENDLEYLLNFNSAENSPQSNFASLPIENTEIPTARKSFKAPKKTKVSVADITRDINDIDLSSDTEDNLTPPPQLRSSRSSSVSSTNSTKERKVTPAKSQTKLNKLKKKSSKLSGPLKVSQEVSEDEDETTITRTPEQIEKRRERNRRRRERRKGTKKEDTTEPVEESAKETTLSSDISPEPSSSPELKLELATSTTSEKPTIEQLLAGKKPVNSNAVPSSNLFDIKLRSTKKSTMNSKYSDKLPEIQPMKTIIGLSHKQILNLDISDVKIKTIVASSKISKYASTALNFTIKQTDELFSDFETKKIFILLCINVALYESIGFKKTTKIYPNILELFGGYDEINLETTRTKLTPSSKDIHQNNLDYSVLSYIGNILIWAVHQQRQGGVTLLTKKFDISLPATLIRQNVGGYHLWDRLIREPQGMNAKRWKHIVKFRQAFPYEEDQFMLILRFMKLDEEIP